MIVKAISLWEPWASLMRCGAKSIETRSWSTPYRGPLLICAAKRKMRPEEQWFLRDLRIRFGDEPTIQLLGDPLYGQAVCLVDLYTCRKTETFAISDLERVCGDFGPGRFGWMTRNLRTFEPFGIRGAQGLFAVELPDALLTEADA